MVESLKSSICAILMANKALKPEETRRNLTFVEQSAAMVRLFAEERFMRIARAIYGPELKVYRSVAIAQNAGAGPLPWHTD